MRRRTLGSTEVFTYTVNYNVEGATVYADGENVGVISNGTLTFSKKGKEALDSYNITFSGTLPSKDPQYTFNVTPTTLSFTAAGGTKSVSVTSTVKTYTQSHASGTVSKNNSLTLTYNEASSSSNVDFGSASNTGNITISGTNITFASNPTHDTRSGIVTFVQDTSSNSAQVTCNQAALTTYDYTVYSNCEGGTVYFNNVNKGKISSGVRSFTDEDSSGTVRISGGVPSSTSRNVYSHTESQEEEDTQQVPVVSQNQSSFSFSRTAQSQQFDRVFTDQTDNQVRYRTKSRRVYDVYTTTYTGPSNRTISGDNSVTMNYTSSESLTGTDYSSWDYGSWSSWESTGAASGYPSLKVTSGSDWLTVVRKNSSGNNWSPYGVYITVKENNTASSRTGKFTMTSGANSRTYTFTVTQAGFTDTDYRLYWTTSSNVGQNNGTTISENEYYAPNDLNWKGFNCISAFGGTMAGGVAVEGGTATKSGSGTGNLTTYSPAISNYWNRDDTCRAVMYKFNNNNTEYYGRGPITVTVTNHGKTIKVTNIIQLAVEFNCGYFHGYKQEYTYDDISASGDTFNWKVRYKWHYPSPESSYNQATTGMTLPANGTWSIKSKPSWVTMAKTSGSMADNDTNIQVTIAANTSSSSRSGDLVLQNNILSSKTATWHITQKGKTDPYVFSASPSSTMLSPTSGATSSILVTSTYNGASQSWSISGTTGSWVSASKSGNYLQIKATSANTASVARLGNVSIKQSGSNKTIAITVRQSAKLN